MAMPIDPHTAVGTEIIRSHVREVLASDAFSSSPKLSRFLEFTVERALAGASDALKEYSLGVEIYGRPPTYDPRTDPIVRVEARRLRSKLCEFYENRITFAPVQIEYPKGHYVPVFHFREHIGQKSEHPTRRLARRVLLPSGTAIALISLGTAISILRVHKPPSSYEPLLSKMTADPGLSAWPALSADGKWVAYASDRGAEGELHIWRQPLAGGEPIRLTYEPGTNTEPSFSTDGRLVAYRSERGGGGIFAVPSKGGAEKQLVARGRQPKFSPDGKWLAYWIARRDSSSARDELYLLPVAGGQPRRIAADFTSATLPNWSSDGKRLLFRGTSGSPETLNWWIVDVEGGRPIASDAIDVLIQHRMVQALPWDFRPYAWLDDRVLFSARLGEVTHIWQLRLSPTTFKASGALERLTAGTAFDAYPTMVKPPGSTPVMAFANTAASINIWSLPVTVNTGRVTGNPTPVTQELFTWVSYPALSADGTKLAHILVRSKEKYLLCLRDLKTGSVASVSPTPPTFGYARVSPDGSRVAYRYETEGREAIYALPGEVRRPEIQASPVCMDCGRPMDWSPDNRNLLFGTARTPSSIAVIDTHSGRRTELFTDPTFDLEAARFSPSGDWIAFCARNPSGTGRIFIARFDAAHHESSRSWIAVTDSSAKDLTEAWSPDGNLLYLLSERDGFRCVWAQPLRPASKRPVGRPFAVRHFHQLRHSLLQTISSPPEAVGLSVTRDRLFFSSDDMTGNIWIARWE
jgi:Tol biopolymer transport system component